MTSDLYCNRVVCRSSSSHAAHTQFSPSQTCSVVTSAFFPPQVRRTTRRESQRHQTQHQMAHQPHVTAPLEMPETQFALAHPQTVFHVPTVKPHPQPHAQRCPRRPATDKVLLL